MHRSTLAAMAAWAALGGPAVAAGEIWLVTEENSEGIKGSQGTWTVDVDGDKISGVAAMLADNGSEVSYKVDGAIEGGVYKITMNGRTDGRKGCVWSGHAPAGSGAQTKGLLGYAQCEGARLIVRASIVGR